MDIQPLRPLRRSSSSPRVFCTHEIAKLYSNPKHLVRVALARQAFDVDITGRSVVLRQTGSEFLKAMLRAGGMDKGYPPSQLIAV